MPVITITVTITQVTIVIVMTRTTQVNDDNKSNGDSKVNSATALGLRGGGVSDAGTLR